VDNEECAILFVQRLSVKVFPVKRSALLARRFIISLWIVDLLARGTCDMIPTHKYTTTANQLQ
jgi:hypothetical protein